MRALALALGLLAIVAVGCSDSDVVADPEPVPPIDDGDWFALVIVGEDESEDLTLGVDLAEMLSGEEARLAAVEDGVIQEGEDLPNDFYIRNPEIVYELMPLVEDPQIELISSNDTAVMIEVTPTELEQLYEGTHPSQEGFYLAPQSPIAMDLTVSDGRIEAVSQVYLP